MASGSSDTIVLVIDEDRVRKVASSTLQKAGFRVLETRSNTMDSFAKLQDHPENIGLAIVDADAGHQEAPELVNNIHRILPESRVLLLSESTEAVSLACRGQRGCWVMQKPFRRARFLGRVLEVFGEPRVLTA